MNHSWKFTSIVFLQILIWGCNPSGKSDLSRKEQLKLDNYFLAGKALYEAKCANCHQANGEGLAALYPPLKNADYLTNNPLAIICIAKNGMEGPLMVNGREYNLKMPANEGLTNLEIAEIATYVLNAWDTKYGIVDLDTVRTKLEACDL